MKNDLFGSWRQFCRNTMKQAVEDLRRRCGSHTFSSAPLYQSLLQTSAFAGLLPPPSNLAGRNEAVHNFSLIQIKNHRGQNPPSALFCPTSDGKRQKTIICILRSCFLLSSFFGFPAVLKGWREEMTKEVVRIRRKLKCLIFWSLFSISAPAVIPSLHLSFSHHLCQF